MDSAWSSCWTATSTPRRSTINIRGKMLCLLPQLKTSSCKQVDSLLLLLSPLEGAPSHLPPLQRLGHVWLGRSKPTCDSKPFYGTTTSYCVCCPCGWPWRRKAASVKGSSSEVVILRHAVNMEPPEPEPEWDHSRTSNDILLKSQIELWRTASACWSRTP